MESTPVLLSMAPPSPAVLFVNVLLITVRLFTFSIAPPNENPPSLLSKMQFCTVSVPWLKIAPPLSGLKPCCIVRPRIVAVTPGSTAKMVVMWLPSITTWWPVPSIVLGGLVVSERSYGLAAIVIVFGVFAGKTALSKVTVLFVQPPAFKAFTASSSVTLPASATSIVLVTTQAPTFVKVKVGVPVAPVALAVTVYRPGAPLAVAVMLAAPLAFVVTGFGAPRVAVALSVG